MAHRTAAKQIVAAINYTIISVQFNRHLKAVVDIGDKLGHQINGRCHAYKASPIHVPTLGKDERMNIDTECSLSWLDAYSLEVVPITFKWE